MPTRTFHFLMLLGLLGILSASATFANPPDIAVGGVDGFESLANKKGTIGLRRSGRVRLYLHDYIWERSSDELRQAVGLAFKGTPSPVLEMAESSHPQKHWEEHFKTYSAAGLSPTEAHVNLAPKGGLTEEQWKAYVDTGRSFGLKVIAPVVAPNSGQWKTSKFDSPKWHRIRAFAEYGGGITIDSPPKFFLKQPPGYQKFVLDEMKWAHDKHLKVTFIISPPHGGGEFLQPTKELLAYFEKVHVKPDAYIVENYSAKPPPNFKNVIGTETEPETVLYVARWLLHATSN